jgi:DNA mismatch endonuclease (patch repair protein)
MVDILTKEERSRLMSKVRTADTKPEILLRTGLHALGLRYTLKNRHLRGSPDLVFPRYQTVVFIHGCFWHRHRGCKDASMPRTNEKFWMKKFTENVERDKRNEGSLSAAGWKVIVAWECEIERETAATVSRVAASIRGQVTIGAE